MPGKSVRRPIALVGPTASGKSEMAQILASRDPNLEIVSLDSMQVYREMDIGTAKPSVAERQAVTHHLIDIVDPSDEMTVARFQREFRTALAEIESRGRLPLLVGGTGLYFHAVIDDFEIPGQYPNVRANLEAEPETGLLHDRLRDLDPVAASRIDPANRRRTVRALEVTIGSGRRFSAFGPGVSAYPESAYLIVGLQMSRPRLDERIEARYQNQIHAGFVEEVAALARRPAGVSRTARQALGYRELLDRLESGISVDEAVDQAVTRTRRFARRQERWFRRDPRIQWHSVEDDLMPVAETLRGQVAGIR